jgi:hypothetical protein
MSEARIAACRLIKILGLVPSFRNLYIVELAIASESQFASIPIQQATDEIIQIARVALQMGECLDYFWFEDCCWRHPKLSFKERDELRMRQRASVGANSGHSHWAPPKCFTCEDSGEVWNQGPGPRKLPCPDCETEGIRAPHRSNAEATA